MAQDDRRSLRFTAFAAIMFFSIGVYALKLFSMQIVQGEAYRTQSRNISQRSRRISAQRILAVRVWHKLQGIDYFHFPWKVHAM